jgi:hypothetical protein
MLVNPGALPEVKEAYDESSLGNGSMLFGNNKILQVNSNNTHGMNSVHLQRVFSEDNKRSSHN